MNKDGDDGEKKKNLKPVTRSNRETTARRTNKHLKSRDRLVRGGRGYQSEGERERDTAVANGWRQLSSAARGGGAPRSHSSGADMSQSRNTPPGVCVLCVCVHMI